MSGANCTSQQCDHVQDGDKQEDPDKTEEDETQDTDICDDEEVKSKIVRTHGQFLLRDTCFVLPEAIAEKKCLVVSEILKIIFNQTVHWKEDAEYDDVRVISLVMM